MACRCSYSKMTLWASSQVLGPSTTAWLLLIGRSQTPVRADLLLRDSWHLTEVAQVQLPRGLTQAYGLKLSDASLKEWLKLMTTQLAPHKECMFRIHPDLLLIPGLPEDQMTGLDTIINCLRVAKNFTTVPCCSVDVGVSLETTPPTASAQCQQLLSEGHALTVVSLCADVLEFLIELRNITCITAVISESWPD